MSLYKSASYLCSFLSLNKGDLGLAKNYRGITLTSIAAKIYNALLQNRIEPKIDNILRKNQNDSRRNRSTTSQILTIRRILEGVRAKNLQATLLFVDFTKAFDSIHRGKMEQILLAYGLPRETVAAIMILCRNTKVKARSPDGDTEYFDIVAGVLQGDTLAPYLFIICLDYVPEAMNDREEWLERVRDIRAGGTWWWWWWWYLCPYIRVPHIYVLI